MGVFLVRVLTGPMVYHTDASWSQLQGERSWLTTCVVGNVQPARFSRGGDLWGRGGRNPLPRLSFALLLSFTKMKRNKKSSNNSEVRGSSELKIKSLNLVK